jgi:phosphate uptake regulator
MLQELLSIFRPGNPLKQMGDEFTEMLRIAYEMTLSAGKLYFREETSPEARTEIYRQDIRVNKLERSIRKRVTSHLALGYPQHLPYCLLLMSQVKDVERLGDYAKNLAEVPDVYSGPMPDDGLVAELHEMRHEVEDGFRAAGEVFVSSDRERALTLIQRGKETARRADAMLHRIAQSGHDSGQVTTLVLGARYYKRVGGHVMNVLSSVVMPLHKVDYFDETELPGVESED